MAESFSIDPRLEDFVVITEVADAEHLAESLLRKKYNVAVPGHGHHVLAFVADEVGGWIPAFYVNYSPHRNAMLIGGACTDGEVIRKLPEARRNAIRESDGLMLQAVRYAEAHFADRSVGTFGHCGDERSWSILQRCGYRRLDHPYLIVRWNREPPEDERRALIESVRELGEF